MARTKTPPTTADASGTGDDGRRVRARVLTPDDAAAAAATRAAVAAAVASASAAGGLDLPTWDVLAAMVTDLCAEVEPGAHFDLEASEMLVAAAAAALGGFRAQARSGRQGGRGSGRRDDRRRGHGDGHGRSRVRRAQVAQ